ncbi:MAG: TIGR03862 family flavoprotein [Pseudomonadota bacterium]
MQTSAKQHVAIVGAGPAGLTAAEYLSLSSSVTVTVYDAMSSAGRKFLMAGRGGLNLTHSEPLDTFLDRYGSRSDRLTDVIKSFSPSDVQAWCDDLDEPTFIGSSGRVFPKRMKASGLLRAWLKRLGDRGVTFKKRHRWIGLEAERTVVFETPGGIERVDVDALVLALGGASWPRLGSDGAWVHLLAECGIEVSPLQPANCGFQVQWSDVFRQRFEGQPLKGLAVQHGAARGRGDAIVTADGIEGGAIYAVSASLRDAIGRDGKTTLVIDLKPDVAEAAVAAQLEKASGKPSLTNLLRKATRLSPIAIGIVQELALAEGVRLGDLSASGLAARIKHASLPITGLGTFEKAISTAGGVRFEDLDRRLMLKRKPGVFVAGEMLDWDAPTGGYLLQACFATGRAAGVGAAAWLAEQSADCV